MPPTTRKNPTPNGPVKKAAPKRVRTTPAQKDAEAQGIAAKRARVKGADSDQVDPYAPTAWGSSETSGSLVDLELPSGQLCLAQRPGPEGLMAAGLLDEFDMLSSVLPLGKKKPTNADLQNLAKNPAALKQMMSLVDKVAVYVVVKPELTPEPESPRDRIVGNIYPSSIDLTDKMYLFNWAVGGTRNLQSFRQQLDESVADVESGADVEGSS